MDLLGIIALVMAILGLLGLVGVIACGVTVSVILLVVGLALLLGRGRLNL